MFSFSRFNSAKIALTGFATFVMSTSAYAGFGWTPAPVQAPAVEQEVTTDNVLDAKPTGPLMPEPEAVAPAPVEQVEAAPVTETVAPEVVSVPEPIIAPAQEQPAIVANVTDTQYAVVEGFGTDIPLVLALRDIVPSSYAFSFDPQSVAGQKISWTGGKAWLDVLNDALHPHHLMAQVSGGVVSISVGTADESNVPVSSPSVINKPVDVLPVTPVVQEPIVKNASVSTIPVIDMATVRTWETRPGATLRQTLESWGKASNVDVTWSTAYDYPIENAFYFNGTFDKAVESLLATYGGQNPAPKGRLYPNLPTGPSVLMIN